LFPTKVVEKIKTPILLSVIYFSWTVYEIMWKNIVELDRPQVTVWHMCVACWIPKTTNTHSEYVVLSTATVVEKMCLNVVLYVHCLSF